MPRLPAAGCVVPVVTGTSDVRAERRWVQGAGGRRGLFQDPALGAQGER